MAIADAGKRKQKHTELLKREHFRYKGGRHAWKVAASWLHER